MDRKNLKKQAFNFEVKKINETRRTIDFIGTTEDIDRYKEILTLDGWRMKEYKKNPVFLWAHEYMNPSIGKTNRLKLEKGVGWVFTVEFASREIYPFADLIFKLYLGGFLKAVSVGFIVHATKYDEDKKQLYLIDKELVELSGVPVPANPNALITDGVKSLSELNIKNAVTIGCINQQEAGEFMKSSKQYIEDVVKELDPNIEYDTGFDLIGEDTRPEGTKDYERGETDNPAGKRKPDGPGEYKKPAEPAKSEKNILIDNNLTEDIKKVNSIYSNLLSGGPVQDNGHVKDAKEIKSMADDLKAALK